MFVAFWVGGVYAMANSGPWLLIHINANNIVHFSTMTSAIKLKLYLLPRHDDTIRMDCPCQTLIYIYIIYIYSAKISKQF
jgi:hypothetical protein